MRSNPLRKTARHEAAHVVVAHSLGISVQVVTIDSVEVCHLSPSAAGVTYYDAEPTSAAAAIVSLAGVEQTYRDRRAEWEWTHGHYACSSDMRRAQKIAAEIGGGFAQAESLIHRWTAFAGAVLSDRRHDVERVASALARAGTLHREHIEDLLGPLQDRSLPS